MAVRDDGSVVTWGMADYGGDGRAVAEQLSGDVHTVSGNYAAFVAVKGDGSVVTWGLPNFGGDCRAVAEQLSGDVHTVSVTSRAGAAVIKRRRVCGDV